MQKIKFTLLVGLVVLMVAMFIGCDPSLGGAKEPDRYFTLQLLVPGTDTVVHTFDLKTSIPNYGYGTATGNWSALEFTPLTCQKVLYRHEPTEDQSDWRVFATNFVIASVSRTIDYGADSSSIEDLTMVRCTIRDFEDILEYSFEENRVFANLTLNQLASNKTSPSIKIVDNGSIEFTQFGEVGGFVTGNIFIQDVKIVDTSDSQEDLMFDIKAKFSLKRDSDIIIKFYEIACMLPDGDVWYYMYIPPEGIFDPLDYSETVEINGDTYEVVGWSTLPGGNGTVYEEGDDFPTLTQDMELYAILKEL